MKKKNVQAFTLMELLAVLVILAIIALIVFPIIGDVITDSKMKAFKSSVDGLEHAVDLDYQKDYYKGEREYSYEDGNLTLNSVKGESKNKNIKVEGIIENGVGTVSVDKDGNTSLIIYNDEYCAVKDYTDKTITVEEKTEDNCVVETVLEPTPDYCFEFDESTAVDSYDINLENCKTYMSENKAWMFYEDETDQNAYCSGQVASDGYSLEMGILENNFEIEKLVTEQVIENVVYAEGLSITGYKCHERNTYGYETITDVVIPSQINDVDVVMIGEYAFAVTGLTSVFIPNTVQLIESYAFTSNQLTSVFIPRSVESIEAKAFACQGVGKIPITYEDENNLPEVSNRVQSCD